MTNHLHRWRIAPANGPESFGMCECGAIRVFTNTPSMFVGTPVHVNYGDLKGRIQEAANLTYGGKPSVSGWVR